MIGLTKRYSKKQFKVRMMFGNLFKRKPVKEYIGVGYQFRVLHPPMSFFIRGIIIKYITDKHERVKEKKGSGVSDTD